MANSSRSGAGTLYLVHVLTFATRNRLDAMLSEIGLSSFQYTILSMIDHHEGLSSASLSKRFHVTPQAMGETIHLLERKELLARIEDARNRKIMRLSLTAEGSAVVKRADILVADFEAMVFSNHSPTELSTFRDLLSSALVAIGEVPKWQADLGQKRQPTRTPNWRGAP